jgi:translation initiation factor 1
LEKELGIEGTLAIEASKVRVRVESRRYGKNVTILEGFDPELDLDALARDLKRALGTGGTVKGRTIEVQGDHRRAVQPWLTGRGFRLA